VLELNKNNPSQFTNLDEWLTHLETAHPVGIDMGLTRINQVKESLGLEFSCPVITVGGTNGKGSTCAFLESILLAAGYKVACHTSPHLLRFNERARINGRDASDTELLHSFARVEEARCRIPNPPTLTYFEFTTLAIMDFFVNAGVDVTILEVGMGGRLDAVNCIDADCAIVTSIDLDHMAFLGNTREAIAFEKAGIFRKNASAICGDPMPPQTLIDHAKAITVLRVINSNGVGLEGASALVAWVIPHFVAPINYSMLQR
jgi:dihydrofolate synthase/folylpolyglutamate synthase